MIIDRSALRCLREDINKALAPLGSKYNISIRAGNCTFTREDATFKLMAINNDSSGNPVDPEHKALMQVHGLLGLTLEDIENPVVIQGNTYVLVGYNSRSKYKLIMKNSSGKRFKFTVEAVLRAIGNNNPTARASAMINSF